MDKFEGEKVTLRIWQPSWISSRPLPQLSLIHHFQEVGTPPAVDAYQAVVYYIDPLLSLPLLAPK